MIGSLNGEEVAQVEVYVRELLDGLPGLEDQIRGRGTCLEIGCGISPYVEWVRGLGYDYVGLDHSYEATIWLRDRYQVAISTTDFMEFRSTYHFELIMMMHSLEHFYDAPAALDRAVSMLQPHGKIIILVPDDQDPVNPDHQWFFNEVTLTDLMARSGLSVLQSSTRRVVEREQFIYALGEKL